MSSALIELSGALADLTARTASNIVAVHTDSRGSSSGVIWRPGVIVTAEHALRLDQEIQVTLPEGSAVLAVLVGRDPSTDLAVLKCPEANLALSDFGDATQLKPGSLTMVVGRTRVSGPIAALGVVSLVAAERRTWTGASLAPYIRLDVSLQHAAIGGAVTDAYGKTFGIVTPRFGRFGCVAIPAALVNGVVETLLEKGRIPHGYLGVGLQPVRLPEALRQTLQRNEKTAAIVLEVEPDGPAHKAGVVIGDIFVAIAGHPVTRLEDVHAQLGGAAIGKPVPLRFVRGGAIQDASIIVGERPHGGQ
jgi:S1-C subfamily serine protease